VASGCRGCILIPPSVQHVALVDDSKLNLRTHALILARLPNVATHRFTCSAEAFAWSIDNDVDCFIVDFRMPAHNGIELTRMLRQQPATQLTPIIMVTGNHEREVRYAALDAGVNDFVEKPVDPREFLARVGTLLALQDARKRLDERVGDLTVSLSNEERRTRDHAARLEALCGIAANSQLGEDEMLRAFLTQSAAAVRPGERFVARLFQLEGTEAVLEATCDKRRGVEVDNVPLGTRVALEETNLFITREGGTAFAYDDVHLEPDLLKFKRLRDLGIRSQITAPMRAGGRDYALTYVSIERTLQDFDQDDLSYVTIVAAFLQAHYQQRWQSDRIEYQSRYDVLTGLINRTRFRALTREACATGTGCSLGIVDLIDFSGVNQRYGNLTGDAMLVEVAAGLAAAARPAEFVGRLGGDVFGICFPGAAAESQLRARLAEYLVVFEQPFSTGDREGREFVHVSARIGAALGFAGLSFNELMSRADVAVGASRAMKGPPIAIFRGVAGGIAVA
jgi:diguanylate cyclase (GGDEF)-like protein